MEKAMDYIRCIDIDNNRRHSASLTVSILTLLRLHVRNYTVLLIALRLLVPVISDLML